ncbi:acyl-CoA dehydrogenase family protein [Acinetobacter puyangensis]|uniref:acyl-CoA dehydrogenase family protein n=1 Tax=Acinetobacter puyangensis TaxID=1096779 RepID=UPI003A4DC6BD
MTTKWLTHQISNQFDEIQDYNLFDTDLILQQTLQHYGSQDQSALRTFGDVAGSAAFYNAAELANRHTPELHTFDARGRRIDFLEFHPAWHQWMGLNRQYAVHAYPFITQDKSSAWVDWASRFYLSGQVESGNLCPNAMTLGSIPLLQREPALWAELGDKLLSTEYDERDIPIHDKKSIWIGMGMTEKQGGSDVRANQTLAKPVNQAGRGQEYLLTGHKWFFSAPMSDAHLVVAQTEDSGLGCFFVPRWLPDGSKNRVNVQRLKSKVGNCSNSSSEVEFQEAWGIMIGEEGRGIPTIIEMAGYTRLTCSVGSSAIMRQALVQCLAYTRQRQAFGKVLADQPLMQSVLVDLALETEAALQLSMHLAWHYGQDQQHQHQLDNQLAQAWTRIMTPAAKFWICKRAVELTGETMEVFGGNGYVDTGIMARLFKEAPVNSIWEGSGNVMCLDVLRAIQREPDLIEILFSSFDPECQQNQVLKVARAELYALLRQSAHDLQFSARSIVTRLVLLAQAVLLLRYSESFVAEAFIQTRFNALHGRVTGLIRTMDVDVVRLLERSFPS